ncbi:hypothetical protein [Nocardioides dongkuii]|uniref:hypothetical protein n=1 Tax=Nocardioides dongkuii TaxID=2760089 RepID=UPI0015FBFFAC|nr:hypothetical protein [Nocardioides dongkuii]
MRPGVRRTVVALALLALSASTTGCAADPDPSPPAGVDGLTVPSPSPDPDDFDAAGGGVDNPWLALDPGSTTTLEGTDGAVTLAVAEDPTTVGGIEATEVTFTDPRGSTTALLAQDDDGNVWRLGDTGAEAGLVMAATPRLGDGYGTTYAGGAVDARAEVTDLEGDTLEVRWTDRAGTDALATFEKGTGLVRLETAFGAYGR